MRTWLHWCTLSWLWPTFGLNLSILLTNVYSCGGKCAVTCGLWSSGGTLLYHLLFGHLCCRRWIGNRSLKDTGGWRWNWWVIIAGHCFLHLLIGVLTALYTRSNICGHSCLLYLSMECGIWVLYTPLDMLSTLVCHLILYWHGLKALQSSQLASFFGSWFTGQLIGRSESFCVIMLTRTYLSMIWMRI